MKCEDCKKEGPTKKVRYKAHRLFSQEELEQGGICLYQKTIKNLCSSCFNGEHTS